MGDFNINNETLDHETEITYLIICEHLDLIYIFNKNVRPTPKSLGARLKSVQNAKKVLGMGL